MGAGPFWVASRPDDDDIMLERSERWHGGSIAIERIDVRVVRDETSRVPPTLGQGTGGRGERVSALRRSSCDQTWRTSPVPGPGAGFRATAYQTWRTKLRLSR